MRDGGSYHRISSTRPWRRGRDSRTSATRPCSGTRPWPESISDGVRLATWQPGNATGWGFLQAFEPVNGRAPDNRHLISAPIDLQGKPAQVALNVDGLSEHAQVAVTIMDQFFRPLTGYAAEDCLRLASGLHRTVAWRSRELVEHADNTIRIRLDFTGIRPEDPKLYAIYIEMK